MLMPSFDIVSEINKHELDNALTQARKEIGQRFDFRGTDTEIEELEDGLVLKSNSDGRLDAAWDVLTERMVKRGIPLMAFDRQKIEEAGGNRVRQLVKMQQGIPAEKARVIVKLIKESKLKVTSAIQGDAVRVSGKKRDDLQEAIALLRKSDLDLAIQFNNFRD
jgi:cyclic-di-GMP-binding protein